MSSENGSKGPKVILFPGVEAPKNEVVDVGAFIQESRAFLRNSRINGDRPCIEMMMEDGLITQEDLVWDQDTGKTFIKSPETGELISVVDFMRHHYLYPTLKSV